MTPEQADALAPAQSGRWRIIHNGDGTLTTIHWNIKANGVPCLQGTPKPSRSLGRA